MRYRLITALYAVTLASIGATHANATTYNLTTIDVPGAIDTDLGGINNLGQLSGTYIDAGGSHGFTTGDGPLAVITVPGSTFTAPHGINDAGQVTGIYSTGGPANHGFVDTKGVFTSIDVPGALSTEAFAINNAGQVAGLAVTSTGVSGFLDTNGTFTTIAVPGAASTIAYGINNTGLIVGTYTDMFGGGTHGFVDDAGVYTPIDIPTSLYARSSPNALIVPDTQVFAINDSDYFVGSFSDYNGTHAFVDVNGFSIFNGPGAPDPFIVPYAINNAGQVAGVYEDSQQVQHGFVANPTDTLVPEPASATLLAAGIACLALLKRRKA